MQDFTYLLSILDNSRVNGLIDMLESFTAMTDVEKQFTYAESLINDFGELIAFNVYTNTKANFIINK